MTAIVTVTFNPAIDKITRVDRVVPERKLRCERPRADPGGGGINVARAVHRLGGEAAALWSRGGRMGRLLGDLLDGEGIPNRPVDVREGTRENIVIGDETSGQQFRFNMPGPRLDEEETRRWLEAIAGLGPEPAFAVLSGSLAPGMREDAYAEVIRALPPGCRAILDTSGEPLRQGLEAGVYLVKPNLRELGQLAGRDIEGDEDVGAASKRLVDRGKAAAVLTSLAQGGAILVTAGEIRQVRAPTVKIRSRIGAGDSMVAGVVLALSRGLSLWEAALFGVAAGSAAVMAPGTELCRRADAERLYRQMCVECGRPEVPAA